MRTLLSLPLWIVACSGDQSGTVTGPTGPTDPTHPTTDPTQPTNPTAPTPPEICPNVEGVSTARGGHELEGELTVSLDGPGNVWVVCQADDDPDEAHLLESESLADAHTFTLRGLLPQTAYSCEAGVPCGESRAETRFTSGAVSPELPVFAATHEQPGQMGGAYTLLNTQQGCGSDTVWVAIVDPDGRYRWAYPVADDIVVDIDATLIDSETLHVGGGWGIFSFGASNRGVFRTIDLSGQVILERDEPDYGLGFNHHSEPLPDGSYLTLTGNRDTDGDDTWNGNAIELWHPDDGLLWTWDSQGLVDSGFLSPPSPFDSLPYHANAVSLVTDSRGEAAWVSIYGREEIWRIDRSTGDLDLVFGPGGDFALFDPQGDPLPDSEFPWVQHGPDYTDDGRVLVYDNGNNRPGGEYSRVAEYQLDLAAQEAVLLWSWTEPGWHNPIVGDADYLPNGNVLVTQGFNACFDPFGNDVSELVEIAPPDEVVWRLTWPSRAHVTYRSERYDGCDVFHNARYCPEIASRISELRGE